MDEDRMPEPGATDKNEPPNPWGTEGTEARLLALESVLRLLDTAECCCHVCRCGAHEAARALLRDSR